MITASSLIHLVLLLVVLGVIFWLLYWLIGFAALPEPFNKIARILIAVVAVVILINELLSLLGHPLLR